MARVFWSKQPADHRKSLKQFGSVGSPLQGFGQVTAGMMNNLMPAPLPQETLGNIIHLAVTGNIGDAVTPVIFC